MSFTANIDDVVAENRNHLLGKHPKWERVRLKEVATILNGYPFESARFKRSGGTPLIRIRDILDGRTETFYDGEFDSTFLVKRGEILIGMDGDFHCEPWAGEPALLNQRVCKITPDESRYAKQFLRYLLPGYLSAINAQTPSVTVKHLSSRTIADIPLPFPPLPEQRRIVAELEKQFTRLEAGVAALRRVQANLKRYRTAVLKAACEGRLVPTEAELTAKNAKSTKKNSGPVSASSALSAVKSPGYETGAELLTRILAERRKNWTGRGQYKEPAAPNTTNLGPLPEGWTWATFEQISERVTVGFVGSMKHEYVENGVPFLRGQNVRENRFDPEGLLYISPKFHQTLSKSAIRPGDLAVVRSGSVGVTCVIPDSLPDANCADLVLVQRPLGFVPQYGAYYMNSLAKRHVAAGKVGVALIHFNTKSVAALAVPLPPLAEQTRIVAEVERRLSVVEELESVVNSNLQRATRLRQSILQKAFTGQL